MYKKILIIVLFISGIMPAQPDFIKPITNYAYDSQNPFIMVKPAYSGDQGKLVFEIHAGSSVNIGLINYLSVQDSFTSPIRITNNNYNNIKPSIINYYDSRLINLFQTDQEGNQDIAISEEQKGNWGDPVLLTNTPLDETNPSFLLNSTYETFDTLWVIYEKEQSIHLLSFKDSVTADRIIFQANDSITYSQAEGIKYALMNFVVVEHSPSYQKIAYRTFNNVNGDLSSIETINVVGISNSPKIFHWYVGSDFLSYELKPDTGYQNIFYIYNWPVLINPEPWIDEPMGDISSLAVAPVDLITKVSGGSGEPNTYLVSRNDSTFIRLNYEENQINSPDTLLFTKVNNANSDIGLMGEDPPYLIYFTIFEDSTNGHINLFARKQKILISEVVKNHPSNLQFALFRNYPNPFNPSTNLSFVISSSSFVTLKVYDVLGNEVATLVNEEKSPGSYKVNFNAQNLSSGVYYYRLKAGNNSETKKMILLK